MADIASVLARRGPDARQVRDRMDRAPTPREHERWHGLWLLARGWSASKATEVVERDARTSGAWLAAFAQGGPAAWRLSRPTVPPPSTRMPGRG